MTNQSRGLRLTKSRLKDVSSYEKHAYKEVRQEQLRNYGQALLIMDSRTTGTNKNIEVDMYRRDNICDPTFTSPGDVTNSRPVPTPQEAASAGLTQTLKRFAPLAKSSTEHPVERFLTPGSVDPSYYAKGALDELGTPFGDAETVDQRIAKAKENFAVVQSNSGEKTDSNES
ncbi:hypothetical protein AJ80_02095 [Polytolypa hystricis UAMH7299]|uniref:Uncharacterized protein n=1 Tax=Polytolypa hystricis (strain UAMH7299) TaxID=1447883 RepID=A0A2B7YT92_POLH7|nr:hypothetical protein AJ80_02095 [Polytolypa hystricis UAMH7299]